MIRPTLPLWYRMYKSLELALSIWAVLKYPTADPFDDISFCTALSVGWIVWK